MRANSYHWYQGTAANAQSQGARRALQIVLDTTELVENIIKHLPARNIFGVQRVCKTFAGVIATSPSIQQKMFRRLHNQPEEQWVMSRDSVQIRDDTDQCDVRLYRGADSDSPIGDFAFTPVALNPLFAASHMPLEMPEIHRVSTANASYFSLGDFWCGSQQKASFLDTCLSDPPRRSLTVKFACTTVPKEAKTAVCFYAKRSIASDQALTVRETLHQALELDGDITYLRRDGEQEYIHFSGSQTVSYAMKSVEEEAGSGNLQGMVSFILEDTIVPTEAEQAAVDAGEPATVSKSDLHRLMASSIDITLRIRSSEF